MSDCNFIDNLVENMASAGADAVGSKDTPTKHAHKRGDQVYVLNPKYKDGTRLRKSPRADSEYNGVWLPNDTFVTVEDCSADEEFYLVQKSDGDVGWIRARNISTHGPRKPGVTKNVLTNEMVTPDPEYVMGMKIYGCGIKEGKYFTILSQVPWIER